MRACVCRQDALVECSDEEGMVFSPLEVTQGVPPFGGENALDEFIAAGCDGTSSSCVVRVFCGCGCVFCHPMKLSVRGLAAVIWTFRSAGRELFKRCQTQGRVVVYARFPK